MTIWRDVREGLRQLRRSPGFTAAAVLSLALGIGANTAIFSLLDQVLLRPLPVAEPDRLVRVRWEGLRPGTTMGQQTLSYPAYRELRDGNQVFSGVLCRFTVPLSVAYRGRTERASGELVSGNYFEVLGVRAVLGRTFGPDDDRVPGGHPLAVLSHDYWVTRFGADPAVLGQPLIVDGRALTIVGVGPKGFGGVEPGYAVSVWIPVAMKAQMTQGWFSEVVTLGNRFTFWVQVFARLKPGLAPEAAQASLQPAFHAMLRRDLREPDMAAIPPGDRAAFLRSWLAVERAAQGHASLRRSYERPLLILMAIVGVVLLTACANVANLLLERAAGRQREIAVRLALGASMWRITRHLLTESLLLAMAGGIAGLVVAIWTSDLLVGFVPQEDARVSLSTMPDARVLGFTLLTCVATGLLFGLAPALAARSVDPAPALKQDARSIAGGAPRFRAALVVAQIALSLVLAIGAGLFVRTLGNLRGIDAGIRTADVVVFSVNPSLNGYDAPRSRAFYRDLLDRLREMPGAETVGASAIRVLDDWWTSPMVLEGEPTTSEGVGPNFNLVSPGYLATLGIPLIAGRDFTAADAARPGRVALVNESFVRTYARGGHVVGRRFAMSADAKAASDVEIVGVMKDAKYGTLREETRPQVFLDNDQNPDIQAIHLYVRTARDPAETAAAVRRVVAALDSAVAVWAMGTMAWQVDRTLARERMVATLTSAFGLLTTILAAVGIYALLAFSVTRRTREIGVRVALGARRAQVIWLVLREVFTLVAIGVGVAVPAAWALSTLVRAQLYEVPPGDWVSTSVAALGLTAIAGLAAVVPARRASTIDPIRALRTE